MRLGGLGTCITQNKVNERLFEVVSLEKPMIKERKEGLAENLFSIKRLIDVCDLVNHLMQVLVLFAAK